MATSHDKWTIPLTLPRSCLLFIRLNPPVNEVWGFSRRSVRLALSYY